MNELLESAKAVIEEWNSSMPHDGVSEEAEEALRAAVERAESDKVDRDDDLFAACMYGARTERERIKSFILESEGHVFVHKDWLLDKIDEH